MSSIQIEINFHLQGSYSIFNSNCIRNIGEIYTLNRWMETKFVLMLFVQLSEKLVAGLLSK